jgi:branched-chain amino acid transport system permease protein
MNDQTRLLPQSPAGRIAVALLFGLLAIIPAFVSTYHVELITTALIAGMLALSLQLLVGATGLVSLGHGAFYGLAAYVVYLVSPEGTAQPIWLTLPLAMAVAALAALAIGALSLRTKGFFFLMVTLAFGQMIFFVFHDTKLGGGTDGAYLAKPLITLFGQTLDLPRRQKPLGPYYVALLQLGIMYLGLAWLLRSLFGRVLEGIRANEHRMQAIGYNTYRYKLAAFVIAGSLAGAAGHMWALHRGFVNPELIGWHKSAEALLMILLGGLGSLAGPIVGALAYTALGEFSGLITERKLLVEGLVILAVVLILPHGITGIKFWRSPGLPKPTDAQLGTTDTSLTQATREASAND